MFKKTELYLSTFWILIGSCYLELEYISIFLDTYIYKSINQAITL